MIRNNIAISENGFIFNPSTGDAYSVNPTGQEIINLIKNGTNEEQIILQITENYHVEKHTIEKDLADFMNMLKTFKILA